VKDFSNSRMQDMLQWLKREWSRLHPGDIAVFQVLDPDTAIGQYSGEPSSNGLVRSYRSLIDLADLTGFQMLSPRRVSEPNVEIRFRRLDPSKQWPPRKALVRAYHNDSTYRQIVKFEEPWFCSGMEWALDFLKLKKGMKVLGIGTNRGDEWSMFQSFLPADLFESLEFYGVDIDSDAIALGRQRFSDRPNLHWIQGDISDYQMWDLPMVNIIVSIDTLQSSGLNGRELIQGMLKQLLIQAPAGPSHRRSGEQPTRTGLLLGFPNCRYTDGEISYGARMKNYREPDMSLLSADIDYYRKMLQKKGFTVRVSGKYTIFLVATKG